MSDIVFSCIIPASKKDAESEKLQDLIASIKAQDFQQDKIEILVITEGDSESAKGIGIKRARGEICAMFCADNEIKNPFLFSLVKQWLSNQNYSGYYSFGYYCEPLDKSLNRYFSLIGNNDPIPFYLNKCDRRPQYENNNVTMYDVVRWADRVPSLGDNGFFVRRSAIMKANIEHYYPMDAFQDIAKKGETYYVRDWNSYLWHRTSDNLLTFLTKRYRYARDLYCDRGDRRWRMVDTKADYARLALYVLATLTVIQPLYVSFKGYSRVRDPAWFWHWPVCVGFLVTYTILAVRNCLKYQLLFRPWTALKPLNTACSH